MSQQQTFNNFSSPAESGVLQIGVDTSTSPGTNPVTPDDDGQINVTGGQVAAGTTANVIRTDSLADHEYTIQIQRSQATEDSTIAANGVCHFSSTDFTVDANGFVQAAIPPSFNWQVITTDTDATDNSGYFANAVTGPAGLTVTLPLLSDVGDSFIVYSMSSAGFEIGQNASQFIQVGENPTTVGTSGNIISTKTGDSITLVCSVANTQWEAVNYTANFLIN